MKEKYLVSIITPLFNSGKYIADTIRSVQAQTYRNWELLITDDKSTDNSREIVEAMASNDSRIKYYLLEKNSGAGVARNNSINNANGRFIAFLDSDDMWMPDKLEKQLEFMQSKDCALSYTSYLTIDESNSVTGIVLAPMKHNFFQNKCDDKIGFSTAIYDVSKLGKVYMPSIRKRQDWGLTMSLLQKCKVAFGMKQPLGYYRKGQDSLSKNKRSLVKYNIMAYQSVLGWSKIRSFVFLLLVYIPCNFSKKIFMFVLNKY